MYTFIIQFIQKIPDHPSIESGSFQLTVPRLPSFLYMVTVNGIGGTDASVVLRRQVKVFETLLDEMKDKNERTYKAFTKKKEKKV